MPAPPDLEEAAQRSSQNVTASELTRMIGMYEPFSLSKLTSKRHNLHELSMGGSGSGRISPSGTSPRGSGVNRRSSSYFREQPENIITESAAQEDDDEEEEKDNRSPKGTNVASL